MASVSSGTVQSAEELINQILRVPQTDHRASLKILKQAEMALDRLKQTAPRGALKEANRLALKEAKLILGLTKFSHLVLSKPWDMATQVELLQRLNKFESRCAKGSARVQEVYKGAHAALSQAASDFPEIEETDRALKAAKKAEDGAAASSSAPAQPLVDDVARLQKECVMLNGLRLQLDVAPPLTPEIAEYYKQLIERSRQELAQLPDEIFAEIGGKAGVLSEASAVQAKLTAPSSPEPLSKDDKIKSHLAIFDSLVLQWQSVNQWTDSLVAHYETILDALQEDITSLSQADFDRVGLTRQTQRGRDDALLLIERFRGLLRSHQQHPPVKGNTLYSWAKRAIQPLILTGALMYIAGPQVGLAGSAAANAVLLLRRIVKSKLKWIFA